jgi:hypothetical protein
MNSRHLGAAITITVAFAQHSNAAGQSATQPLAEASQSTIGFESVAEAEEALRSTRGVEFRNENGWLIAMDKTAHTIWSFAPPSYSAYPAVVKRQAVQQGSGVVARISILCEASKEACDALVRTFAEMSRIEVAR